MRETSLYPAVKRFLEAAGFHVKGEVNGCDVVAVQQRAMQDGQTVKLAIVEMKLGFNLDLLLQATDRIRMADEVWLAVPATRRGRDRDPRVRRLCRLIGLGLMVVNTARDRVEVLASPEPYRPRPDLRRRTRLLSEHARRNGDPSAGGSTREPIMTAYRQQALACAALLRAGSCRPCDLRAAAPDAGRILLRNVYGWFERTQRGVYRLTTLGEAALQRWPDMKYVVVSGGFASRHENVVSDTAANAGLSGEEQSGPNGFRDVIPEKPEEREGRFPELDQHLPCPAIARHQ